MRARGIVGETAETIVRSIGAFALYGFPESHAASFALIAYASAYLKAYHPAVFLCALLNNQPMGFYRPMTLVKDAQRHGVRVLPIDVASSGWDCALEAGAVRIGLAYVRGLRRSAAARLVDERQRRPFFALDDLVERVGLHRNEVRSLAEIGALSGFGLTRRGALWQVERACRPTGPLFRGWAGDAETAPLAEMTGAERLASDIGGTGLTVGPHPMILYRPALAARDVKRARDLAGLDDGQRVTVAGAVICRQRPGTAKGFLFLTLEDETGLVNVTVRPDLYGRKQALLVGAGLLEIDGVLQTREGISLRALDARPLAGGLRIASRDFR